MAEDKIRYSDISDPDVFKDVRESADSTLSVIDKLTGSIVTMAKSLSNGLSGKPENLKQLKDQLNTIGQIDQAELAFNKTQAQRIAIAQKLSELRVEEQKQKAAIKVQTDAELRQQREAAAAAKKQAGAYAELSKRHRELVKEAKDLAASGKLNSEQFKKISSEANKLDAQLKKIDATLGIHTRKVGQYENAWKGVAAGFQNFLGQVGISVGIGAVVHGLTSSVESFIEAEKRARALEFALKNVANEGTIAFQKLINQSEELQANGGIFSDDDIQGAQTQLVNYGLLSDEIEELMPKILDLATVQGVDLATATDIVIKGINGQTKGLKTVGLGFEDTGSRAENYAIILDKLTKFEGAAGDAALTTEGKYKVLMNRFDDLKEDIGEFLVNAGTDFLQFWDILTNKISMATAIQNAFNNAVGAKITGETLTFLDEISGLEKQDQINMINASIDAYLRNIEKVRQEALAGKRDAEDAQAIIDAYTANIRVLQSEIKALTTTTVTFNKRTGDTAKESAQDFEDAWKKAIEEVNKEQEEWQKDEERRHREAIERDKHRFKLWREDQDKKQRREYMEYMRRKRLHEQEVEEEKRRRREQLEEMIGYEKAISDGYFEGKQEQYDKEEEALRQQGENITRELDIQSQRQLAGLDNTYAEQQRLKAENDAKLAALEEKRRRTEDAKDFAELFIEFTKAYAKDGDINAAQKALTQTIETKAIASTIAGSFEEGTEDTGNKTGAGVDGRGGTLNILHPNERVVPKRLNRLLNGISNDELVESALAFQNIYRPQLAAVMNPEDAKNYSRPAADWMGSAVLNELVEVKKTIRDKTENNWGYDQTERAFYHIQKKSGSTKKIYKRF